MAKDDRYALTRSLHAPFYARLDTGKIGAFGHSIGGLTAARTCQIDLRVKACMAEINGQSHIGGPYL